MRKNVASIQFLRFIAATLVVLFHSTQAVSTYFVGSLPELFVKYSAIGASGVHIFFVISGFIMVYTSFYKQDDAFNAPNFITKRIIRIYPIYFVYSALYLYFYDFFSTGKDLSVEQFLGSILLFPDYSSLIIGPGWTLSFEVYFYACFAIAMIFGLTRGLLLLSLFFLAAIVLRSAIDSNQPVIHVMTSSLLIEFLLGAWIGYATVSMVRISNKMANFMLALAVAGFLAGIVFTHLPSVIAWGIPSTLLVAGFVFKESNGRIPFLVKKCSFLGDSSYSLYLLHIVLIDAIILLAIYFDSSIGMHVSSIGFFGMMMVCFAITIYCIAMALISYELIEHKVVSSLQNLCRRKFAPITGMPNPP
jgi:exopolysaccharide production protein ExoZ